MTKEARRLNYAIETLELWLEPMKMPCPASGHNTPNTGSCTCRNRDIRIRTREFLAGIRKSDRKVGP